MWRRSMHAGGGKIGHVVTNEFLVKLRTEHSFDDLPSNEASCAALGSAAAHEMLAAFFPADKDSQRLAE